MAIEEAQGHVRGLWVLDSQGRNANLYLIPFEVVKGSKK